LLSITTKHGEIIPGSIIKKSDLEEKDFNVLLKAGTYFEEHPKLAADIDKPIPKLEYVTKDPDGKERVYDYSDEELTLPSNYPQGQKALKKLREDVTDGLESYEKVDRMIAKVEEMNGGKLKTRYLNELYKIKKTQKKPTKG